MASLPVLAALLLISCHHVKSTDDGFPIKGIYLSEDSRTARIVFGGGEGFSLPSGVRSESVSVLHHETGIEFTCRLIREKNGYTFSNYGRLLKKGDSVSVRLEKFSPTAAVLE